MSRAAFSGVRGNAASNLQIAGNTISNVGEVAIYSEFGFEGVVIANNTVDGAALGISVTNFNEGGRLAVKWTTVDGKLNLTWRETARSFTPPSERKGFGTTVLENMVGRSLGAEVERIVHPDGLEWRFSIPTSAIDPSLGPDEVE